MAPARDAAVIARGTGGVICALTLASWGARTILVIPAPLRDMPLLRGTQEDGLTRAVLEAVGAWTALEKMGTRPAIACQAALPGRRLDISPDPGEFLKELGREYPDGKEDLASLMEIFRAADGVIREYLRRRLLLRTASAYFPYRKMAYYSRLRLSAALLRHPGAAAAAPLFHALASSLSSAPKDDPSVLDIGFLVGSLTGTLAVPGGGLRALIGIFQERGGILREGSPPAAITFSGKTPTGLTLAGADIPAGIIATDAPTDLLAPVLPAPFQSKIMKRFRSLTGRRQRYHYGISLPENSIPAGMEDSVLFIPQAGPAWPGNLLSISGGTPDFLRIALDASDPIPVSDVLSSLRGLLPFLPPDTAAMHTEPISTLWEPRHWGYLLPLASRIPLPVKNCFQCGDALLPSLALEGEALAGHLGAREIARRMGISIPAPGPA